MPNGNNRTTIIIAGPTGTGKTAVACALARLVDGEIISADSRQIYTGLDIGTNKAGTWDDTRRARITEGIPQYLTDIAAPSDHFSAGDFVCRALEAINALSARGKQPIVVGGTGLYIKALVDGLAPLPPRDAGLRKELAAAGPDALYRELKALDPEAAEKHRHNPQRLVRALEVCRLTGTPLTQLQHDTQPALEHANLFGIHWERTDLYRLLNDRCTRMIESGMIEETKRALAAGYAPDSPGLQGIGYRDLIRYLRGEMTLDRAAERMRLDTRHYAKRQMTWFRGDDRIHWIPGDARSFDPDAVAREIMKFI
jgi:tRNA dimethylallyltransferase